MVNDSQFAMARTRAIITETERRQIAGENGDQRRYEAASRVRARVNEELPTDIELLAEHHPNLLNELRDVVFEGCSDTPAVLRFDYFREEEISGETEISLDVTEMSSEGDMEIDAVAGRLGLKFRDDHHLVEELNKVVREGGLGTLYVGTTDRDMREYRVRGGGITIGTDERGDPCILDIDLDVVDGEQE